MAEISDVDLPSFLLQRVCRIRTKPAFVGDYLMLASDAFLTYFEPILRSSPVVTSVAGFARIREPRGENRILANPATSNRKVVSGLILTGVSVPHISPGQIKAFRFRLPSVDEQRGIFRDVKRLTDETLATRERVKNEIELMSKFRTTLIAEALTGKIDVRSSTLNKTNS